MTRFPPVLALFRATVFLCAAWAAGDARAQAVLDTRAGGIDLWPHVRMLTDPAGTLSLEQALEARDRFAVPGPAHATLGMGKEVVWLRVPIKVSAGGEGLWILDFDYALLRRVDVYRLSDGKVAAQATLGIDQPFASRPLGGRSHAVPLEFGAASTSELLMRVDSPAKILPVSLARLPAFHLRALNEQILQGVFAGIGLFLLLYSLAQWVSLREKLYLKYALLLACSATFSVHFFGIGEMYLWRDAEWAQRHLAGVSALMAAAATALFVDDAMGADLGRWLRRGLRAVTALHILATFAYSVDLIDLRVVAVLMTTTGLAPALMGLPAAIAKARRGDHVGHWFIVAWVGYFITSAILVGVVRGRIGADFWTLHSFEIGATLDMLIFMRIAVLRTAARHQAAQHAALERDWMHSLAHSDALTGLLNRRGLDDALAGAQSGAKPERLLALYVLDLDGFKAVNDQFGHDAGDSLLQAAAQRLRSSMRAGDAIARIGGDEFVVMAYGLANETQARDLGTKLVEAFRTPFTIEERDCRVGATVGYALAPIDAESAGALLKAADAAMYAGKQQGKDRLVRAEKQSL